MDVCWQLTWKVRLAWKDAAVVLLYAGAVKYGVGRGRGSGVGKGSCELEVLVLYGVLELMTHGELST